MQQLLQPQKTSSSTRNSSLNRRNARLCNQRNLGGQTIKETKHSLRFLLSFFVTQTNCATSVKTRMLTRLTGSFLQLYLNVKVLG